MVLPEDDPAHQERVAQMEKTYRAMMTSKNTKAMVLEPLQP
ncbi:MAG: hypothetical protein ACLFVC_01010 [Opitutales bacterium]